jgi:hypothetical protein
MSRRFTIGLLVLLSPLAFADEPWTLTTADLHRQTVYLRSFDERGASVSASESEAGKLVPAEEFLQIERPVAAGGTTAAAPRFTLVLLGGDRFSGQPLALVGETLRWQSPTLGEIPIPLGRANSLVRADASERPSARPADAGARRAEDLVTLTNGDAVRGLISAFDGKALTVQSAAGDNVPVPLDSVASVLFASPAGPAKAAAERAFRLRLSDGSSVTTTSVSFTPQKLTVALPAPPGKKDQPPPAPVKKALDPAALVSIEQLNGPLVWLSSLTPVEDVQVPFLGAPWPTRFDRSVTGEPIRFRSTTFTRGIGVHAYSRITYDLDGTYKAFRTQYAIDGELPLADVAVRVLLDGKVAYENGDVRAGVLSPAVVVPLNAAKKLTLEADYGNGTFTQSRLNWIEPALLKEIPPPEPATAPAAAPASAPATAPASTTPAATPGTPSAQ